MTVNGSYIRGGCPPACTQQPEEPDLQCEEAISPKSVTNEDSEEEKLLKSWDDLEIATIEDYKNLSKQKGFLEFLDYFGRFSIQS